MTKLDSDYIDLYKSVDNILNDAYSTNEGVKAYIETMKNEYNISPTKCNKICNWEKYYKMLLRLKTIRNRISHDNGENFALESDMDDLENFKSSLLNGTDPLALLRKEMEITQRAINNNGAPTNNYLNLGQNDSFNVDDEEDNASNNSTKYILPILLIILCVIAFLVLSVK